MPIVNGNYYMNGDYGQSLEQGRIADAFPGLATQTGSGSWVDRLVDHLTTPRSATEPPPPPAPPEMPPEAYDGGTRHYQRRSNFWRSAGSSSGYSGQGS